jgi:hypothetical protein
MFKTLTKDAFCPLLEALANGAERQFDFAPVPKESTPTSGMFRYRSA